MPRVSAAFFAVGVLCVIAGMMWGMQMAAAQIFTLAPAHAHLNLLGWVTMGLYGTFYALTRETMSPKLAWTNFVISTVGLAVMIPSLIMLLSTGNVAKWGPIVGAGSGLAFLGMVVFFISVVREMVRKRA